MAVRKHVIDIATNGAAGSASGSGVIGWAWGKLLAVRLSYSASAPSTTDVTITSGGRTLLQLMNDNTNRYSYPRIQAVGSSNALISGAYVESVLDGQVSVQVDQCNALDPAVTVTLFVEI